MTMIHPGTAHILAIYSTSFYGNAKMNMQSAVCVVTTSMLSTLSYSWYTYTHTHTCTLSHVRTHTHTHTCTLTCAHTHTQTHIHIHTHCTHLTYLQELGKQNHAGAPGAAIRVWCEVNPHHSFQNSTDDIASSSRPSDLWLHGSWSQHLGHKHYVCVCIRVKNKK